VRAFRLPVVDGELGNNSTCLVNARAYRTCGVPVRQMFGNPTNRELLGAAEKISGMLYKSEQI
jgi:hypothetical protein